MFSMYMSNLTWFYFDLVSKTSRNHISMRDNPHKAKYATPLDAFCANRARLYICDQLSTLELRDDYTGCLPY